MKCLSYRMKVIQFQVCNYLFLSNKVDNSIIVWKARLLFSKSNRGS